MELSVLKSPDLVVALDIGSTYSGYAWQWRSNFEKNRGHIEYNNNWGTAALRLPKTTTCLLLNENLDVDSFGQLAEKRFCNECDRTERGDLTGKYYFFKNFKMCLYNQDDKDATDVIDIKVDDHFGQPIPLIDVMSKFIQAMRDDFLNQLRRKNQKINLDKTLWVITVPAIWTDAAKRFMRLAAEKGGIQRKNVLIAHEPEAAALHCIHLPSQERQAMGDLGEKGDSFITVDLGGGTTDVLALTVRDNGMLEEISLGSGGLVGGQDINNAFFQACTDAFKDNVWSKLSGQFNAEELLDMENDFEDKKVTIGSTDPRDEYIRLAMPECFKSLLEKGEIKLKETDAAHQIFKLEKRQLLFSSKYIREFLFKETLQRVFDCLQKVLKRNTVKDIAKVVLVGGFCESPIVIEKIAEFVKEHFPEKRLVVPTSPFTAVLSGAVLFGHDPMIFFSRICRATYGIEMYATFDGSIHREDKRCKNVETDIDDCKDVLDIHIEKGTPVRLGKELHSRGYIPRFKDQKKIDFSIYMSTSDHLLKPVYTTDDKCKKIGEIVVDMPDTSGGRNRNVEVTMVYGGTELDVIAKNKTTGEEYKAQLSINTS